MHRLLPVMRFHQQLKERIEGSYTHEQPVAWHKQRPRQEMIHFSSHACQQVQINIKEVSEDEAERTQVKNRSRKQDMIDVYHRGAKSKIDTQQHPHQRIDEYCTC